MSELDSILDAEVRRAEPDLWLASRLVGDPAARGPLIALYAVHGELAKVADTATNPLAGEIRLAWWREEIDALFEGKRALGHPALQALRHAGGLDRPTLEAILEARHSELEARPFSDEGDLLAYLDGVYGGLMRTAASLLAPVVEASVKENARAFGWAWLLHQRPAWVSRGRDWTPKAWAEASDQEIAEHVRHRVADALKAGRAEAAVLPTTAFPAIAPAALAPAYAEGRRLSPLQKRLRLVWSSLRGHP